MMHKISTRSTRWIATFLFLLAFGLMTSSALQKSATIDEQSHLFRGAAYLREGATHFLLGHPLLASALSALPLLTEPDLRLPLDAPAWVAGDWSVAGDAFLWRINDNPQRLLFLGRLPVIWLALLLGALVFRWGWQLAGGPAGLLALFLLALDPNVLAHGRFITGDLPLTLFFTLTIYGFWLYAWHNAAWGLVVSGAGLGLAGATKFNAALLLPILGLLAMAWAWKQHRARPILHLIFVGLIGWFLIWAVYRFTLWRGGVPGGAFWDDLFWELRYFNKPHGAYLAGQVSTSGWWYYFPVTFLLKTPLPSLLLLAWAAVFAWRRRHGDFLFLLLPPFVYFGVSLTSSLNIGYRYLLPVLPFLYLATAVSLIQYADQDRKGIWPSRLIGGGCAALLLLSVWVWPDYTSYFNVLAGGNGWRILSDSNVDWGQDLPSLATWQRQTGHPLKLSYFGTAHPSAYGLDFTPLPTWEPGPEQGNPAYQAYNPANPAPGWYAISVTNLHGIVLGQRRDMFAWFREKDPAVRIGGSIFIYEVSAADEPVQVTFSGLRPMDLPPEVVAFFDSNDVIPRWFDARTSLVWPAGGGWQVVRADQEMDVALAPFALLPEPVFADESLLLSRLPAPPTIFGQTEVAFGETAVYLGASQLHFQGGEFELITGWRVLQSEKRPLKIFVHALDSEGEILGQWDGLDVASFSWHSGDMFLQLHRFQITVNDLPSTLSIGLYDAISQERLGEPVSIPLAGLTHFSE